MHNDTPLGATMHLKELNRQATPKLNSSRVGRQDVAPMKAVRVAMIALRWRLNVIGVLGQAASQG